MLIFPDYSDSVVSWGPSNICYRRISVLKDRIFQIKESVGSTRG